MVERSGLGGSISFGYFVRVVGFDSGGLAGVVLGEVASAYAL